MGRVWVRVCVPRHVSGGPGDGAGHVHVSPGLRGHVLYRSRVALHLAPRQDRDLHRADRAHRAWPHHRCYALLHRYKVMFKMFKVFVFSFDNKIIFSRRPVQYRDLTDYTHSHSATPNRSTENIIWSTFLNHPLVNHDQLLKSMFRASYKITINQSHSELDTEAELQLPENLEEKTKF